MIVAAATVSLVLVSKEASVAFADRLQFVDGEGHTGYLDTVVRHPNRGDARLLESLGQASTVRCSWHHEYRLPSTTAGQPVDVLLSPPSMPRWVC